MSFAPWHLAEPGEIYFAIDSWGQGHFFKHKPVRIIREGWWGSEKRVSWRGASWRDSRPISMSVRSFVGITSEYAKMSLEKKPGVM